METPVQIVYVICFNHTHKPTSKIKQSKDNNTEYIYFNFIRRFHKAFWNLNVEAATLSCLPFFFF